MLTETIGPGQVPFNTTDAILAFSLYLAGVPFFNEKKPCMNIYDENILSRLGFQGKSLEDATRAALARKKKGHVEYGFKQVVELGRLLDAYKSQAEELTTEGADEKAHDVVNRLVTNADMDPQEKMIRLACVVLKMRVQFVSMWQNLEPLIRVFNTGTPKAQEFPDGSKRIRHPGFRIVSLNASKQIKDKMKL